MKQKNIIIALWLFAGIGLVGAETNAPAKNPKWPNLEEVIICWKTHLDIGYTDTIPSVIDFCRQRLPESALGPIEATHSRTNGQRFTWMLPSWAMSVALDK